MRLFTFYLSTIISLFLLNTQCNPFVAPIYTLSTSVVGEGTITPPLTLINSGGKVLLTATPSEHWVFDNWSEDGSGSSSTVTITMDKDKYVVANFSERLYSLNIAYVGEGTVTEEVIQSKSEHTAGTVVQLTPVPNTGWKFVEWSGGVTSTDEVVTVTVDGEVNVTVTFERIYYPLTITIEGEGTVTEEVIQSKSEHTFGTVVQLTPVPDAGWKFVKWSGDISSTDEVVTVIVDGEVNVTVTFDRIDYPLTITIEGEGTVEEEVVQAKTTDYPFEITVSLTAIHAQGWVFSGWGGDLDGSANPESITMESDKSVSATFTQELSLAIVTTAAVSEVTTTTASSGGEVTSGGNAAVSARGVVWGTSVNPTLDSNAGFTEDGTGTGSFTSSLSGLSPDTQYYVRSYATNSEGTAYGNQQNFTTDKEAVMPSVSTSTISSITETSAQSGGNVTGDGGATVTALGVCWSTSQNPTTADSCTSDGSGTGSFTSNLTNLTQYTQYYVRAYATNSEGTAYGNEQNFITVVVVTSDGRIWMDRNLGASRAATASTDTEAYGDLYQWGRGEDGHQKRSSSSTSTLSSSDQPGHGSFILAPNSPNDWRSPQNGNLWQGVNGINNPCPQGFRLPTAAEWEAERQSWSSDNASGALSSPLKLPMAGLRNVSNGSLDNVGSNGRYWSGAVDGSISRNLLFDSSFASMFSNSRANGFSVRCIKD